MIPMFAEVYKVWWTASLLFYRIWKFQILKVSLKDQGSCILCLFRVF